jgi:hypothetical protein
MTMISRMRTLAVAALAPALLGGCYMSDGLYGGLSVGAGDYYGGSPYGYDPYGYDPYGGYYGGHSYGWYDNYYYPGNGGYIYDRAGRRYAMRAQDRAYWLQRREARADRREDRLERRHDRLERRQDRIERRASRPAADPAAVERRQARRCEGLYNREARQVIRQAARGRERGQAATDEP